VRPRVRKWAGRLLGVGVAVIFLVLLVGVPLGGSFLITNTRFSFPDPGPSDPVEMGLDVTPVQFESEDGVQLYGWWNPSEGGWPVIVFVHGLNRSRIELLERAAESRRRGYGTLLFDLRNHGESDRAFTTLGIDESMDVCAAEAFVESSAPGRSIVLWGVSLGASTALLSANHCSGAIAAIADSSFLSFEDTVSHHFELITPLPSFPIADILIGITQWRMGFTLDEGDVELAVANHPDLAVLIVAGTNDQRMPPDVARRLHAASSNPNSEILMIDGARHGQALQESPERYLAAVFGFLDHVVPTRAE